MSENMVLNYILEREKVEYLEYEHGFMFIKRLPDCVYIQDIYVKPEFRGQKAASAMLSHVERLCGAAGLTKVLGSCDVTANGATHSMKTMLKTGFRLHSCAGNLVYLVKDLKGETK